MQHHTLVICPVPTGLILSFQYEIVTYLYIEHKITGFTKLPDTGGYGEFFTKKAGYKRVWIWPSGVERGGSQNFAPRRALPAGLYWEGGHRATMHQASDRRRTENAPRPAVPRKHVPCHYPMNGARMKLIIESAAAVSGTDLQHGYSHSKWRTGAGAVNGSEVSRRLQSASRSFLLPSAHASCCRGSHQCHAVTGNDVYRRWCPQLRRTLFALTRDLMRGAQRAPPVGFSPITQIRLGIALWNFQYLSGHQFYASTEKKLSEVT